VGRPGPEDAHQGGGGALGQGGGRHDQAGLPERLREVPRPGRVRQGQLGRRRGRAELRAHRLRQGLGREARHRRRRHEHLNPEEVTDCAIPVLEYAFTIGYNTDTFAKAHPTTWAEFFDTKRFPGKRGFWKYATGAIFEAALLADGVQPDALYPLDIDRAFKKLDTIKDDIVFYETGEQQQQLVASGEAPLVQAWNGRIYSAAKEGQPVANEWNQHLLSYDQLVIPKGAKNAANAQKWMKWYVEHPEAQAGYSNATAYGPITQAALEYVKPDVLAELPTSPENAPKRAAIIDYAWWADNYDAVSERLNEWASQ